MEKNLRKCLNRMTAEFTRHEAEKKELKLQIEQAYMDYGKSLEFGDDVIPQKALEKVAKAFAVDKFGALTGETTSLINAIQRTSGTDMSLPFPPK